jgi:hypothetical protein
VVVEATVVSIGFRPSGPVAPPPQITLWVVLKDTRNARATVRQHPHGRELVVLVGEDIAWSRLYRDHEDSRDLGLMAEGTRLDFERLGWVTDTAF